MSYKELLNDGCDDTSIYFQNNNLFICGYSKNLVNSLL